MTVAGQAALQARIDAKVDRIFRLRRASLDAMNATLEGDVKTAQQALQDLAAITTEDAADTLDVDLPALIAAASSQLEIVVTAEDDRLKFVSAQYQAIAFSTSSGDPTTAQALATNVAASNALTSFTITKSVSKAPGTFTPPDPSTPKGTPLPAVSATVDVPVSAAFLAALPQLVADVARAVPALPGDAVSVTAEAKQAVLAIDDRGLPAGTGLNDAVQAKQAGIDIASFVASPAAVKAKT